jgi:hypothetical protein
LDQSKKFGIVSLQGLSVDAEFADSLHLAPNLRLHRVPAYPMDTHWKEWLGSLTASRYERSTLHIISEVPTETPGILDREHKDAYRRAYQVYWCLSLVGFVRLDNAPIGVRGSVSLDGTSEVRSVGEEFQPVVLQGSPFTKWTVDELGRALRLQRQFERMQVFPRLQRIHDAFHAGLHSRSPDFRLHQFVRCIEGFISAEAGATKKRFKSRTELFVGPDQHELMGRLYDVRSKVEHLHDPVEQYSGSKFERWLAIWRDAVVAEGLARAILRRFAFQEQLWPSFVDDSVALAFWKDYSASDRRDVWGDPLDVSKLENNFQGRYLDPEDLGLREEDR